MLRVKYAFWDLTYKRGLKEVGPPKDLVHWSDSPKLRASVLDLENAGDARRQEHRQRARQRLHRRRSLPRLKLIQTPHHQLSQRPNLHHQKQWHHTLGKKHQKQKLNHFSLRPQISQSFARTDSYPEKISFRGKKDKILRKKSPRFFEKQGPLVDADQRPEISEEKPFPILRSKHSKLQQKEGKRLFFFALPELTKPGHLLS